MAWMCFDAKVINSGKAQLFQGNCKLLPDLSLEKTPVVCRIFRHKTQKRT